MAKPGDPVKVHYNLHRCPVGRAPKPDESCWVVRGKSGRVEGYASQTALRDVKFVVQPGGLKRVRERGSREVIAYATGTMAKDVPAKKGIPVCFNPYKNDTFVHCKTGRPIKSARFAYFAGREASAEGALGRPRRRRR